MTKTAASDAFVNLAYDIAGRTGDRLDHRRWEAVECALVSWDGHGLDDEREIAAWQEATLAEYKRRHYSGYGSVIIWMVVGWIVAGIVKAVVEKLIEWWLENNEINGPLFLALRAEARRRAGL